MHCALNECPGNEREKDVMNKFPRFSSRVVVGVGTLCSRYFMYFLWMNADWERRWKETFATFTGKSNSGRDFKVLPGIPAFLLCFEAFTIYKRCRTGLVGSVTLSYSLFEWFLGIIYGKSRQLWDEHFATKLIVSRFAICTVLLNFCDFFGSYESDLIDVMNATWCCMSRSFICSVAILSNESSNIRFQQIQLKWFFRLD